MGDRGQVKLIFKGGEIYFYSHWGGTEILQQVQQAIAKRWRWDDPEYLARIIFDCIKGNDTTSETSYGIGMWVHGDLEHPLVCVDLEGNKVWEETTNERVNEPRIPKKKPLSFKEFCSFEIKEED